MRARRPDEGFTLIEVVISMLLFAVLLLVFTRGVGLMTTATARVTTNTDAANQVRQATALLSRQLGGAGGVNSPVASNGSYYLEFQTDAVVAGADATCTQWRYTPASGPTPGVLQYRTWSTVALTPTTWFTVARNVANDPVTEPVFTVYPSDSGFRLPRVAVDVLISSYRGNRIETEGQYTLRNATDAAPASPSAVCTIGAQVPRP